VYTLLSTTYVIIINVPSEGEDDEIDGIKTERLAPALEGIYFTVDMPLKEETPNIIEEAFVDALYKGRPNGSP
jgi:hypothetical protein